MKPGDHPDFFRFAPPPGTSRESTIRLDREGRFFHDGERVDHPALERALSSWIARHPDDGRFILTNGYDWTYFQVDDAPFIVRSLHLAGERVEIALSDETIEALDVETVRVGAEDALYVKVKGRRFEARFSRYAQAQLAPVLVDLPDGGIGLRVAGVEHRIL